jgi:phage-related protein
VSDHKVKSASWEELMEPKREPGRDGQPKPPPPEIEFDFKTGPTTRELEEQIRAAHRAAHANIPSNAVDKSAKVAWHCALGRLGLCVDKAGVPVTTSIPSDANSCPHCGLPRPPDGCRLNARDTKGMMKDTTILMPFITLLVPDPKAVDIVVEYLKLVNFGLGDCVDVPDRAGNVARAVVLQTLKLERTSQNQDPWEWFKGDSGVNVPKGQEINVALIRFPGWSSDQDEIIQVEALRPLTDLSFESFGDSLSVFRRRPLWQNDDRWAAPMEFAYWLRWSAPSARVYIGLEQLGPSNFVRDVLTGKRCGHRLSKVDEDVSTIPFWYAMLQNLEVKKMGNEKIANPIDMGPKRKLEQPIRNGDSKMCPPISDIGSKTFPPIPDIDSKESQSSSMSSEEKARGSTSDDDEMEQNDNSAGSQVSLEERTRLAGVIWHRMHSCIVKMSFDGKQCTDCGIPDVNLLEHDHLIPDEKLLKQTGTGQKVDSMIKVPLLVKAKELRKCNPACLRCHRVRTFESYDPERYVRPSIKEKRSRVDAEKTKVGCILCGFSDPKRPYLFDYDHLDPEQKVASISNLIARGRDWDMCETEMGKCRPICCNCHRKHTSIPWPRLEDFTNEEKELARIYLFGTPEQILLLGKKRPVVQVRAQTGEVVAIFPSLKAAADDVAGHARLIRLCMKDPQQKETYKKCLWLVPTFEQLKLISHGINVIWRNPNLAPIEEGPPTPRGNNGNGKSPVPVAQVDEITGVLMAVFPNQREAAAEVEAHQTEISKYMSNGKAFKKCLWRKPSDDELKLMTGGRAWRNPEFKASEEKAPPVTRPRRGAPATAVAQVDEITGVLMAVFPSQAEAAQEVEGHQTEISKCVRTGKTYKKCLWRRPSSDELKLIAGGRAWRNPDWRAGAKGPSLKA